MKKEVANVESNLPQTAMDTDFGDSLNQAVDSEDLVIPKLILSQPGSPQVIDGDWMFGELRSTLDDKLMADAGKGGKSGKTMDFIPICNKKFWIVKRQEGSQFKFETMEEICERTKNLNPWEQWTGDDGALRQRQKLNLFYILVEGYSLPFTLGFRGASIKNGGKILTQMAINKGINTTDLWKRTPFAVKMKAVVRKEKKGDNNYTVLDVAVGGQATFEQVCEANKWFKTIKAGETKIDNSDIEEKSKKFADPDSLEF
jgi:hypothetical protein